MPRSFSAVTAFASEGLSTGATQMFITPSLDDRKLSCLPSGLSLTPLRSGLPNSTCLLMRLVSARGGVIVLAGAVVVSTAATVVAALAVVAPFGTVGSPVLVL